MLRYSSRAPPLKDEDVEKQLLLSTSVPIKIGNENAIKKDTRSKPSGNRMRYTFGLRSPKPSHHVSHEFPVDSNKIDAQPNSSGPETLSTTSSSSSSSSSALSPHHRKGESKLVDNLSNNTKLVKQTTIDYYV